jgi:hypothetical protein
LLPKEEENFCAAAKNNKSPAQQIKRAPRSGKVFLPFNKKRKKARRAYQKAPEKIDTITKNNNKRSPRSGKVFLPSNKKRKRAPRSGLYKTVPVPKFCTSLVTPDPAASLGAMILFAQLEAAT